MFLPLYFNSGPMQSWGYGSYKKNRNTKLYPTQSAIIGMICKVAGIYTSKVGKENFIEFIKKIQKGKFHSILFRKNGILTDFQTIGTNYNIQGIDKIFTADGKKVSSVIVEKQYLENAITGCIIEHDKEILDEIFKYFNCPQSFVGIGRACCVPCDPIVGEIKETFKEAFISLANKSNVNEDSIVKIVSPDIRGYSINDIMIDHQEFASRLVLEKDKTLSEWKKILN